MDRFKEEKALGDEQCLDSLEEKISMYLRDNSDNSSDLRFKENIFGDDDDNESDSSESHDSMQRTEFWDSQEAMLQEVLAHSSLICSKLQREVSQAVEMMREIAFCRCPKPSSEDCLSCLRRSVINQLSGKGFNAALCTSKWKSSHKIFGGKHEFIDVIIRKTRRRKETRLLIELGFQAEFEMAKACDEYRNLITQLPTFYVGKPEHLNAIVRIVCDAAKRSMQEKKLHMGPWRKRSFMLMKWSGSSKRKGRSSSSSSSSCQSSEEEQVLSRQIHMPSYRYCLQFSAATTTVLLVT